MAAGRSDRLRGANLARAHRQLEAQRWVEQHYPELQGRGGRVWARARGEALRSDPNTYDTFRYWFDRLEQARKDDARGRPVDRGPTGVYAQALVEMGYRPVNAWWDVGESDEYM